MSLSIVGTIVEILDVQQISDTFKKREFVVEYVENPQYPEFVKFETIQDKCAQLDAYKVGDKLTIQFNLKGRKWTDKTGEVKYFNSLQAWKLEAAGSTSQTPNPQTPETAPLEGLSEPSWSSDDKEDDLPF